MQAPKNMFVVKSLQGQKNIFTVKNNQAPNSIFAGSNLNQPTNIKNLSLFSQKAGFNLQKNGIFPISSKDKDSQIKKQSDNLSTKNKSKSKQKPIVPNLTHIQAIIQSTQIKIEGQNNDNIKPQVRTQILTNQLNQSHQSNQLNQSNQQNLVGPLFLVAQVKLNLKKSQSIRLQKQTSKERRESKQKKQNKKQRNSQNQDESNKNSSDQKQIKSNQQSAFTFGQTKSSESSAFSFGQKDSNLRPISKRQQKISKLQNQTVQVQRQLNYQKQQTLFETPKKTEHLKDKFRKGNQKQLQIIKQHAIQQSTINKKRLFRDFAEDNKNYMERSQSKQSKQQSQQQTVRLRQAQPKSSINNLETNKKYQQFKNQETNKKYQQQKHSSLQYKSQNLSNIKLKQSENNSAKTQQFNNENITRFKQSTQTQNNNYCKNLQFGKYSIKRVVSQSQDDSNNHSFISVTPQKKQQTKPYQKAQQKSFISKQQKITISQQQKITISQQQKPVFQKGQEFLFSNKQKVLLSKQQKQLKSIKLNLTNNTIKNGIFGKVQNSSNTQNKSLLRKIQQVNFSSPSVQQKSQKSSQIQLKNQKSPSFQSKKFQSPAVQLKNEQQGRLSCEISDSQHNNRIPFAIQTTTKLQTLKKTQVNIQQNQISQFSQSKTETLNLSNSSLIIINDSLQNSQQKRQNQDKFPQILRGVQNAQYNCQSLKIPQNFDRIDTPTFNFTHCIKKQNILYLQQQFALTKDQQKDSQTEKVFNNIQVKQQKSQKLQNHQVKKQKLQNHQIKLQKPQQTLKSRLIPQHTPYKLQIHQAKDHKSQKFQNKNILPIRQIKKPTATQNANKVEIKQQTSQKIQQLGYKKLQFKIQNNQKHKIQPQTKNLPMQQQKLRSQNSLFKIQDKKQKVLKEQINNQKQKNVLNVIKRQSQNSSKPAQTQNNIIIFPKKQIKPTIIQLNKQKQLKQQKKLTNSPQKNLLSKLAHTKQLARLNKLGNRQQQKLINIKKIKQNYLNIIKTKKQQMKMYYQVLKKQINTKQQIKQIQNQMKKFINVTFLTYQINHKLNQLRQKDAILNVMINTNNHRFQKLHKRVIKFNQLSQILNFKYNLINELHIKYVNKVDNQKKRLRQLQKLKQDQHNNNSIFVVFKNLSKSKYYIKNTYQKQYQQDLQQSCSKLKIQLKKQLQQFLIKDQNYNKYQQYLKTFDKILYQKKQCPPLKELKLSYQSKINVIDRQNNLQKYCQQINKERIKDLLPKNILAKNSNNQSFNKNKQYLCNQPYQSVQQKMKKYYNQHPKKLIFDQNQYQQCQTQYCTVLRQQQIHEQVLKKAQVQKIHQIQTYYQQVKKASFQQCKNNKITAKLILSNYKKYFYI